MSDRDRNESKTRGIVGWGIRLIATAVVLAITSFLTPGFTINGMWSYLIAAVVISTLDYIIESAMGVDASPIGKGVKGFLVAAIIIYVAQFIVPNMSVSIIGALLAAVVIGILDMILPGRTM